MGRIGGGGGGGYKGGAGGSDGRGGNGGGNFAGGSLARAIELEGNAGRPGIVKATLLTVNIAPVARVDLYPNATEDTKLQTTGISDGVLGNDSDADNDLRDLTAVLDSSPEDGTLMLNANGSFEYTPNQDFCGGDSFRYHANDGRRDSNVVSASIAIACVNDAPSFTVANPPAVKENAGPQTAQVAFNFTPGPANESGQVVARYKISDILDNGAVVENDSTRVDEGGVLSYTPVAAGSVTFKLKVQDNGDTDNGGVDTSAAQTITITIVPAGAPVVSLNGPSSANEGDMKAYSFEVADSDSSETFTVNAQSCGSSGTLSNASFDSTTGAGGFDCTFPDGLDDSTVSVQVADSGSVASNIDNINVGIANVAPTVTATNSTVTANEGQTAANSGSFGDVGDDTVAVEASIGTVTGGGTKSGSWSWSYITSDGPDESQTVTITATDSDGAKTMTTFALTVNNVAPTADAGGPYTINEGDGLTLGGSGGDVPADTLIYSWDVNGDGAFGDATGPTPTLTAAQMATLGLGDDAFVATVTLRVTDDDDGETDATTTLTVDNVAPTADAGGPYVIDEGDGLSLDGSGGDVPADTLSYSWDVNGDGAFGDATGPTPTLTAAQMATLGLGDDAFVATVTLRVTDDDDGETDATTTLTVDNVAPTADAGGPYVIDEGDGLSLDGSGGDVPADTLSYSWDVNGDGAFGDATGPTPTLTAAQMATLGLGDDAFVATVTLRVTDDDDGETDASTTLTVDNVAPTADAGGPYLVDEGSTVGLSGTGSDVAGPLDPLTFAWDLDDDGHFETPGADVTFDATGLDGPSVHTVRLKVTDDDDGFDIQSTTVTVDNVSPTAGAGGPYSVDEGSTVGLSGTGSDVAGHLDPLTFAWDLDDDGHFETPGADVTFDATGLDGPSVHTVRLKVTDDDDGFDIQSTTVTINNVAPTADAGGPYTINEGDGLTLSGSGGDVPADTLSYSWDVNGDGAFGDATGPTPTLTAAQMATLGLGDDASVTVTLRVDDGDGGSTDATTTLTVNNVAPVVNNDTLNVPIAPVALGTSIPVSVPFTDVGTLDTHTVTWDWGDGTFSAVSAAAEKASGSHTYAGPGVYTISCVVVDDDGGQDTCEAETFVVVFDANGGFVTGGGWIDSPAGAYTYDPTLFGKASSGFVSKYKKGATVPTGNTEFQFHAGDLNFHSSTYQWLVVAGHRAMFKGTGTINGSGNYGFLLTAIDKNKAGEVDRFRIKIWDAADDTAVVYDNVPGATDDVDDGSVTEIANGSIVIHTKGKGS